MFKTVKLLCIEEENILWGFLSLTKNPIFFPQQTVSPVLVNSSL